MSEIYGGRITYAWTDRGQELLDRGVQVFVAGRYDETESWFKD